MLVPKISLANTIVSFLFLHHPSCMPLPCCSVPSSAQWLKSLLILPGCNTILTFNCHLIWPDCQMGVWVEYMINKILDYMWLEHPSFPVTSKTKIKHPQKPFSGSVKESDRAMLLLTRANVHLSHVLNFIFYLKRFLMWWLNACAKIRTLEEDNGLLLHED